MIDSVFRNFVILIKPNLIKKEYDGHMRTTVSTYIELTEIKTGKLVTKVTDKRVTDTLLKNIILKEFKDSQVAGEIRSLHNLSVVTLNEDCSVENVAANLHTALRKLCDSTASAYWWNLIHILPKGVMGLVWEATGKSLKKVGDTAALHKYATFTKEAWFNTFDKIEYATIDYDRQKHIYPSA